MLAHILLLILLNFDHSNAYPKDATQNYGSFWTRAPSIGQGPRQEQSVISLEDEVYVLGGVDLNERSLVQTLNRVEYFDVRDSSWHVAAPLPQPLNHANAAVVDGKIYVLGALNADSTWKAVPDAYVYHRSNDTWLDVQHMVNSTARGSSAVAVYGTKIYLGGGMTFLQPFVGGKQDSVAMVSSYDASTDSWDDSLPALPEPRQHVGSAVVGSNWYVIGGRENGVEEYHNTTYALDLNNPTSWKTLSPMPTARGSLSCSPIGTKIYCFGGEGNPENWQTIFNETEAYDTATDTWEKLPAMQAPRHGTGATTVGQQIWIPGGGATTGLFPIGIMDSFTPGT